MIKYLIFILLLSGQAFSQNAVVGKSYINVFKNGIQKRQTIVNPLPNEQKFQFIPDQNTPQPNDVFSNTLVKWSYTDPASVGDYCEVSGNGKYCVVGWDLNNKRVSLYGNADANPAWEFLTDPNGFVNFVSISDTGGTIGAGSYHNQYFFNNSSSTPFFSFDLTHLADTGLASSLDVTGNGQFVVCSASRNDSSTIFGFNTASSIPVWSKKIVSSNLNGSSIQGIRLSGNDSLVIVNTYYDFYVMRTYTGEIIYQGLILNGTQTAQGISGDGSLIAVINYRGLLRVFKWDGSTYNLLFQNTEPPGQFYNWYSAVDISYDGSMIAAGTLNFLTSSTYDGKVKVFKQTGNGVPDWTFTGCGDEVTAVSFSKNGNILSASSYGEFNNTTEDLYIFKTGFGNNPIYKLNTPGSFFWCSTSDDGRTVVTSGKAVHARQFGSGGLMYNIDVDTSDIPSSVNQLNSSLVTEYQLSQNYPNPFNPTTNMEFGISKLGFVSLKVYDVLGNEVSNLVNETKSAGSYSVSFDGSNLSSGLYFYSLSVDGVLIDTKKMILSK